MEDAGTVTVIHGGGMARISFLTKEDVKARLGPAKRGAELVAACGCIDGRQTEARYGMLGSTAGVFLRTIAAYLDCLPEAERRDRAKTLEALMPGLMTLFDRQLPLKGHTDDHDHGQEWGCGYLRALHDQPYEYGIQSRSLVQMVVDFIDDRPGTYEVLQGNHDERAILVIQTEAGADAPTFLPNRAGNQVFTYHPSVEAALYDQHADGVRRELNELLGEHVTTDEYRHALTALTERHVVLIANSRLAAGKPVVTLSVRRGGDWSLDQ
ncbi:hypothetical protein HY375_03735 [Candidatus Berkelbacteria bacterium]|nr:hypothetical protein [Candidatus Berkelbacteria bacterium]